MNEKSKISTESYKGVRDFYPEDMFVQNHIFATMRKTAESFGYNEYNASIIEPAELYVAKSGEEIVNEQTYTFADRGERSVTLRPEMTPTVARMVAGKSRELVLPLRWYSIPNLFRYEKPQRGRLREHWQLNVDIFGVATIDAEIEILSIAYMLMKNLGAQDSDFVIKINNRKLIQKLYEKYELSEEDSYAVSKLIDKKDKISAEAFAGALKEIIGEKSIDIVRALSTTEHFLDAVGEDNEHTKELILVIAKLKTLGIENVVFDPTLMRGFDYYTAIVFEVFDTSPENKRALFGGGRYDDLLDIFGSAKIPTVGFGMGDVTARDFLEIHNLLPTYKPSSDLYICTTNPEYIENAEILAQTLRSAGVCVTVDITHKKMGDQIKIADRQHIPFVICIGEDEIKSQTYKVKNMSTGEETESKADGVKAVVQG